MTFIEFINSSQLLGFFLKLFGIVLGLLYLFFAIIMVKQVQAMKRTVSIQDNGLLMFVAYVQVLLAFVALAYALFIL